MSLVRCELADSVGTLTLDDPRRHHRLGREMLDSILSGLDHFADVRARVVVLRALPGSKVFSAGYDLKAAPTDGRDPLPENSRLRFLLRQIQRYEIPTIALVEGAAYGGGCELVMACDLAIAEPCATFSLTPAKWGVAYDRPGIQLALQSLPARIVREMFLTAAPLSAERAYHFGLVHRLVPREQLDAATDELAAHIKAGAPSCLRLLKETIRLSTSSQPLSQEQIDQIESLRRAVYEGPEAREGIGAFWEKRSPDFQ